MIKGAIMRNRERELYVNYIYKIYYAQDINKESRKLLENNEDLINELLFYKKNYEKKTSPYPSIFDRYLNANEQFVKEPFVTDLFFNNDNNFRKFEYPENAKFAVCLTHDVDEIYPPLTHIMLSSVNCVRQLDRRCLANQLNLIIDPKKKSPYKNFRKIMKLEDEYNAKSSFYFLATEKDIKRFRYEIEDLNNEIGFIADHGWEVGLHGGYYTYDNLTEMEKEKKRVEAVLNKKILGYRNHYLRMELPRTWNLLVKAGFKYDTTFGFNDAVGFRNGLIHPFQPFDTSSNKKIDLLEIPLNIQDGALFSKYGNINSAWKIVNDVLEKAEKYGGVITLLWHSNSFNCPFRSDWEKIYSKILKYCYHKKAWITSAEEVYKWYNGK
jgi:peptidoglycan/xylan/chitin deacetylase (PgdA/CDA1 family)